MGTQNVRILNQYAQLENIKKEINRENVNTLGACEMKILLVKDTKTYT